MLEGLELLYAYLDQNSLRWTKPDEDVYQSIRCVEKELTRTKRALWLARAERAKDKYKFLMAKYELWQAFPPKKQLLLFDKWRRVERKCRAYADKFKEEK